MARTTGDSNFSTREKRLTAQKSVLEAKIGTLKEQLKVKDVRIKELREKLKESKAKKVAKKVAKKTIAKKAAKKSAKV